jgi:hypothetical protein
MMFIKPSKLICGEIQTSQHTKVKTNMVKIFRVIAWE